MALTRRTIFNLSIRTASRILPLNYASQDSSQNPRELFRTGEEGETHKSNESASDVGNRVDEMTEKVKDSMQTAQLKPGRWGQIRDSASENKKSILEDEVDDEDELKKKLKKEAGGKPVDEDKGLDVNWRPIDEN